jgi:hypothetical protein
MAKLTRISVPLLKPEDVIPHLGKPTHWKQGRSAKAVADSWFTANDLPPRVRAVVEQAEEFRSAELIDAWLERCTDLGDGRGTPSQSDLLAILGLKGEIAVMGVEAKVNESFGPFVSEWIGDGSEGKARRLQMLCDLFGLDPDVVGHLRYQLFHRTAAAILEARRYRATKAVMLVQSFCPDATGLADYVAFFSAIGVRGAGRDQLSSQLNIGRVGFWTGWVSDECPALCEGS